MNTVAEPWLFRKLREGGLVCISRGSQMWAGELWNRQVFLYCIHRTWPYGSVQHMKLRKLNPIKGIPVSPNSWFLRWRWKQWAAVWQRGLAWWGGCFKIQIHTWEGNSTDLLAVLVKVLVKWGFPGTLHFLHLCYPLGLLFRWVILSFLVLESLSSTLKSDQPLLPLCLQGCLCSLTLTLPWCLLKVFYKNSL